MNNKGYLASTRLVRQVRCRDFDKLCIPPCLGSLRQLGLCFLLSGILLIIRSGYATDDDHCDPDDEGINDISLFLS